MTNNTNIKVMKTKPTLTDEEIRSHMDFDKLLQLHKAGAGAVSAVPKWLKITGYTASAVLVTSLIVYTIGSPNSTQSENPVVEQNAIATVDSARKESSTENVKKEKTISVPLKVETAPKVDATPKLEDEALSKSESESKQESKQPNVPVFIQAEPVIGYPELYAYFNREIQYPAEALNDSIEGVVSVSFAIDRLGKPTEIQINNSLGALFDSECKRVIENMPEWRPATVNGTPITTRMSIPLTFRVKKN